MEQQNINIVRQEDKIDLIAIAKSIWISRTLIVVVVGIFFLLGILVYVLSPREYAATSVFIPQTSDSNKSLGGLGNLASVAGINLGSALVGQEIPPSLYPKIVGSVSFRLAMLEAPITINGIDQEITYQDYYENYHTPGPLSIIKKYTIGLPGTIVRAVRGTPKEPTLQEEDVFIRLTEKQVEHFRRLDKQISIAFSDKEGIVQLSVAMPEPLASAQMTKFAEQLLQKEVIAYKIQNAKEQLDFTEQRYLEKKKEFEAVQKRLGTFRDRNQNVTSSLVLNEMQQLEAEYNLVFNVYTELAKQLEQSKLQVSKDTPIFSFIQPVTVPSQKSAPRLIFILSGFVILGTILVLSYVLGKDFISKTKTQWDEA